MSSTAQLQTIEDPVIKMRAGQRRLFRLVDEYRTIAFVARRQYGKTTTFGNIALKKMMKTKNHTVIFGSAKLNLSREIVRKEAAVIERAISEALKRLNSGQLMVADAQTGKIPDTLTHDDFADLFETSRLEFRYYHSKTCYSRTKVVALRDDAVGETGDLMADEVGRVKSWREVYEAIKPIIASTPEFRLLIATTPPPDDSHYSFEQLAPPPGTVFKPNPEGNLYESVRGMTVLRVDADDAYLDGVPIYDDKTGKPLSPEEARKLDPDKDAFDRNYRIMFLMGGTSAVPLMVIMECQARGIEDGCVFAEDDLPANWRSLFTPHDPIGIGGDPATTEGEKSNPFGICVTQRSKGRWKARLIISFKSSDPRKPKAILKELATLHPLAIALDATSERYWCAEVQQEIVGLCPVMLIVNSEKCEYLGEMMLFKAYLGNLAVNTLTDEEVSLPPNREIKEDFRLVKRFKGGFDNELDRITGRHGDLFDGFKLSLHALVTGGGEAIAESVSASPSDAVDPGVELCNPYDSYSC